MGYPYPNFCLSFSRVSLKLIYDVLLIEPLIVGRSFWDTAPTQYQLNKYSEHKDMSPFMSIYIYMTPNTDCYIVGAVPTRSVSCYSSSKTYPQTLF